jgi:hypothetical protein
MTRTIDEVDADLQTFKTQVPTLEEQIAIFSAQAWKQGSSLSLSMSGSFRMCMLTAPIPLRVLSVALCWEYWSLAASDTTYWTGAAQIGTGPGGFTTVAQRSTSNTAGTANGPIVARQAWTFDGAAWTANTLDAGDQLAILWSLTGSPAAFQFPLTATIRYAAL